MRLILALIIITITCVNQGISAQALKTVDNFRIHFDGSGADGTFDVLHGEVSFHPDNPTVSTFDIEIPVSSINTGNNVKDGHAQNKNWFYADKYPNISFESKEVQSLGGNRYRVTGDLTMRGQTRAIAFDFTFSENENGGILRAEFQINRLDFGIEGPFLSFMVSDEFNLSIEVRVSE